MPVQASSYRIREARESDIDRLVEFTCAEARDAEGVELDAAAARRGVSAAFADPPAAKYWVAETMEGAVVASISATREWSNFRGGYYWWIQSVFITPEHRSGGLFEQLLHQVEREAAADGALDVRLYVHVSNERARRAYERRGFRELPYVLMGRRPR